MTPHQSTGVPGPVVSGRDLWRRYGSTTALRGASIDVAPAEVVAVTGPSGSGKSTLLHCLAGVVRPDSGTVVFDGTGLAERTADERTRLRRKQMGLVLQLGQLVPDLTAVENVALPLLLERHTRPEAGAEAARWLERLGVADVAEQLPGHMSGGQAQRVAIARALVTSPRVVFADEPTGALDTVTGERTLGVLVESARSTGAALVLVTHDNRVAAVADREVVLRDGAVEPSPGSTPGGGVR